MNKQDKATVQKLAADLNYYGKRLATSRSAVAETISDMVFGTKSRSEEIKKYLEDNKPVKPAKANRSAANYDHLPTYAGTLQAAENNWPVKSARRYILTSAQNNTVPHQNFLKALVNYAEATEAELLISQFLYNKNGYQNGEGQKGIKFDPALEKYFQKENVFLDENKTFAFLAEINILPTAAYPLSGFSETIGRYSAAIGHAQITSEAVPALKGSEVRRLYSTGTVTQLNYIQQKAGQKAEGLHCFGALIVEFDDDGVFHVRQLQTMDESGMFYDLMLQATPDGVKEVTGHVAALQYGDIHAEKIDPNVARESWESENSLLDILRPKYQLIHDIHDFTSRNHHNRASGVFLAKQWAAGRDKVIDDLRDTGKILSDMERDFSQLIVVESNHDLALGRWLDDSKVNIGQDPANAHLFHALNAATFAAIEAGDDTFNVLLYALKEFSGFDINATFLATDQSFQIAGVECGMHGHNGINGSRGAPKQFKKLGLPVNTGHTHSPTIFGPVYTAGVSGDLDMGYNIGAGSWCHTHLVTYENGQRTLIDFKNGRFFS